MTDRERVERAGIIAVFPSLDTRAHSVLLNMGITTKEQLREAVLSRRLCPNKVRNYGKKAHARVLHVLGLAAINTRGPHYVPEVCLNCGKPWNIKCDRGIKEEIAALLENVEGLVEDDVISSSTGHVLCSILKLLEKMA